MNPHHQTHTTLRDRARGCLLGQFIGDSLGSLVEFQPPEHIRATYPHGVRDMADGGTFNILAGQPTDDSQMAMMLIHSLLGATRDENKLPHYDADDCRNRYRWWLDTDPFDVGNTVAAALLGAPGVDSQSNGSLMRVSPIAVAYAAADDQQQAIARAMDAAEQDAQITHLNEVVIDSNRVYVAAMVVGIRGGGVDEMIATARAQAQTPQVREALDRAVAGDYHAYEQHMGWVLLSLCLSFWALAASRTSGVEQALVDVISVGGDTDTHAAIAGALLGSAYGAKQWPGRWVATVLLCTPDEPRLAEGKRLRREFFATDLLRQADTLVGVAD
ncbi:ADP-ribosylglycohydrolase family protein [Corynebacterium aquilae]|uniref:ADP-ribosylglycohydrolase n=1 Tax=Corynebacterium aquilae DSM 44791 TaxID=1431546 RepID=A0A1L7CIA1_9CORY|nr:ADP-ribosylglycohydrolase family protein [Corynebacterium aquilae]APT85539.1 hypothetical protein CAQU_11315 [Corynebacterium aquilae DSM 44791]